MEATTFLIASSSDAPPFRYGFQWVSRGTLNRGHVRSRRPVSYCPALIAGTAAGRRDVSGRRVDRCVGTFAAADSHHVDAHRAANHGVPYRSPTMARCPRAPGGHVLSPGLNDPLDG